MKAIRHVVCIVAGLLLFATPVLANEIIIALGSEPTTLDPQIREDGGERAVNDNVYETLMARLPDGRLTAGLAAAEPKLIDAKTWEVKLRAGIKFHNGEPCNAEAVVHSVKRLIDPGFKSEQISFFSTINDARKVDDLTVQIVTDGPDPILPGRLYWMKMVPPGHSKDPKFAETPVGTGPDKFVKWNRGQNVILESHPGYWGAKPTIQKVT